MRIQVKSNIRDYEVIIERNSISKLQEYFSFEGKVMIITDENIPLTYIQEVKKTIQKCYVYTVKAGDQSKSLEVYQAIIKELLYLHFDKSDCLIALGGGMIGDLTGFVASSYKRGIAYINIPTSTLAQIDSSIGGKVALNCHGVKNCIGFFYPAYKVIIDVNLLKTLPARHYYAGLVEALKAGILQDQTLYTLFKNQEVDTRIEEVIYRALMVKKKIIEMDEFDKNQRKLLNLGHTIGHALESSSKFHLLHGEAVAYGLLKMIDDFTLQKEVCRIIDSLQIDLHNIKYDKNSILEYVLNDKKIDHDKIELVRVKGIEDCFLQRISLKELGDLL